MLHTQRLPGLLLAWSSTQVLSVSTDSYPLWNCKLNATPTLGNWRWSCTEFQNVSKVWSGSLVPLPCSRLCLEKAWASKLACCGEIRGWQDLPNHVKTHSSRVFGLFFGAHSTKMYKKHISNFIEFHYIIQYILDYISILYFILPSMKTLGIPEIAEPQTQSGQRRNVSTPKPGNGSVSVPLPQLDLGRHQQRKSFWRARDTGSKWHLLDQCQDLISSYFFPLLDIL